MYLPQKYWAELDQVGLSWWETCEKYRKFENKELILTEEEQACLKNEYDLINKECMTAVCNGLLASQSKYEDCLGEVVIQLVDNRLHNFDPSKSSFSRFINGELKYVLKDIPRGEYNIRQSDQEKAHQWHGQKVTLESMDVPCDEEGELTLHDLIAAPGSSADGAALVIDDILLNLCTQIARLSGMLQARSGNKRKVDYNRLFFTDFAAYYMKEVSDGAVFCKNREREIFESISTMFLDFFMSQQCRTVQKVCMTDVKLYSQLVPGREDKPCRLKLPNDVFLSYLEKFENKKLAVSSISTYRKKYEGLVRELCSIE